MEEPQLKIGDHFWALIDGHLAVMSYEYDDPEYGYHGYYMCGSYECSVKRSEFQVISIIPKPQGYEHVEYYFNRQLL